MDLALTVNPHSSTNAALGLAGDTTAILAVTGAQSFASRKGLAAFYHTWSAATVCSAGATGQSRLHALLNFAANDTTVLTAQVELGCERGAALHHAWLSTMHHAQSACMRGLRATLHLTLGGTTMLATQPKARSEGSTSRLLALLVAKPTV